MTSLAQPVPAATGDAVLGKYASWATLYCPIYFYSAPPPPPSCNDCIRDVGRGYGGHETVEMTDAAV